MPAHKPNLALRVMTLVVVFLNVAFQGLYVQLGIGDADVRVMSERYDNLFAPASYAFAIWGLIHLAFVVYAALGLSPASHRVSLHERIAPSLIAANVLESAWIIAFTHDQPGVALAIMVATLLLAIAMYRRATFADDGPRHGAWLVPFSVFLAWISVATISNVTIALVAHGVEPKSVAWATTMIGAVVALGLFMAVRFGDGVFPAVVAWAALALAVRAGSSSETFSDAALAGALVCLLATAAVVVLRVGSKLGLGLPAPSGASFGRTASRV